MTPIMISEKQYQDKVLGCWLGKNAGGTLGAPLEKVWGNREPFDVSFYTQKIPEGGCPNDDLEIQLVWLLALEERGLDLTCRDFAEYWLNHIHYNPDEYGFHKLNLRLGLLPPVSGWYNNPFKHNMGCPIRSEIWACIAPAMPEVAVAYAWEDAVCDHAGGESVYGEMYNAALQSAAFVISDRERLMEIGLSVIPEDSLTAQSICRARDAYRDGRSWREARDRVMEGVFNLNGQYSPINLGFQTVGWLYGEDFGDALCKSVNCGWDTDCTAATVGATLGIIYGASQLPDKWLKPLGRTLAVTKPPGVDHFTPPRDIDELTERTVAIGRQLLARHYDRVRIGEGEPSASSAPIVVDQEAIAQIHAKPQNAVVHRLSAVDVIITYPLPERPCVSEFDSFQAEVTLQNRGGAPLSGTVELALPEGFASEQAGTHYFELSGHGKQVLAPITVTANGPQYIRTRNTAWLTLTLDKRPAIEAVPLVMIGARKWLVSEVEQGGTLESFDISGITDPYIGVPEGWRPVTMAGNELEVEPLYNGKPGVLGLQHFFYNPEARAIRIAVPNNYRMRVMLNGKAQKQTSHPIPCHPSFWGDCDPVLQWDDMFINTCNVEMPEGWNHIFIVLERGEEPMRAFLNMSYDPELLHGCDDLEQTRFPWDAPDDGHKRNPFTLE